MSLISQVIPRAELALRIGGSRQHGQREASTLLPPAEAPQPAARLIVSPATGGIITRGGSSMLYAFAVDAAGRPVPGVDIEFASDDEIVMVVFRWEFDARADMWRAEIFADPTVLGTANITVSAAGLPSVVVPYTAVSVDAGMTAGGKHVGLQMADPPKPFTAEEAVGYNYYAGLFGMRQEVESSPSARWYYLPALQAAADLPGMGLILQFFPGTGSVAGAGGLFSVAMWQGLFAQFTPASITPYIGGTLLAHYLLGYPNFPPKWGRVITPAELRTMAATSKAAFPTLPVLVGGEPVRDGLGTGYSSADVDYAMPIFTYGKGPSLAKCKAWADRMSAESIAAGLGGAGGLFYCGLDIGSGGSGSPASDPPGWKIQGMGLPAGVVRYTMSPQEIEGYGAVLGNHAKVLALIMDRYVAAGEASYFSRPDVKKALADLSRTHVGSNSGDPFVSLKVQEVPARIGDRVLLDTSGSGVPGDGIPWVRWINPGDGSPTYGPLPPGAPDPYHVYTAESLASNPDEGVVTVMAWVTRLDTGQTALAETTLFVDVGAPVTGGMYTDPAPVPAIALPTPARYTPYLSLFGHKVYYLADGWTASPASPALNVTDTYLFFVQDGVAKVADLLFEVDKVTVINVRSIFTSPDGGRADSAAWSLPNHYALFTLSSGATGKILEVDVRTNSTAVLKDIFADARFQAAFGTQDRALAFMRVNGTGLGTPRFAATVIVHSSSAPVGVVVWDQTTDAMWFYQPPNACAEIVPDDLRLDASARYLKVGLRIPAGKVGCPAENDRSWQSMDLEANAVGEWVRDGAAPELDGPLENLTFAADGEGLKRWQLFPPQSPGELVYPIPGGNEYMRGEARTSLFGEVAVGYTLGHGGLVGPWEFFRAEGNVYRTRWAGELEAKPYRRRPEVVRRGYRMLLLSPTLADTGIDEWFFDGDWLYVGQQSATTPQVSGPDELMAYDWRFGTEEIFTVDSSVGALIGRLCHHHHRQRTDDPGLPLRAHLSHDGQWVTFTTNLGGTAQPRVFACLTRPGADAVPP